MVDQDSIHELEIVIPCQIVELGEVDAVCSMLVDGYEVPRVSFPVWILRQKELQIGSQFNWIVRDPEHTQPSDIVIISQVNEPESVDLVELESLYEEMKKRLEEDGGEWPIYTGDGE